MTMTIAYILKFHHYHVGSWHMEIERIMFAQISNFLYSRFCKTHPLKRKNNKFSKNYSHDSFSVKLLTISSYCDQTQRKM